MWEDRNFAEFICQNAIIYKKCRFTLFFLLNDANYRQLKNYNGIWIANPQERYIAGKYLNELKDGQLESN